MAQGKNFKFEVVCCTRGFHISYLGKVVVVALQPVRGRQWRGIGREAMMLFLFHEIRGDIKGAWKKGTHAVVAKLRI